MNLRTKLVAALAGTAALATLAVGTFSYNATAQRVEAEIDRSLNDSLNGFTGRVGRDGDHGPIGRPSPDDSTGFGEFDLVVVQVVNAAGTVVQANSAVLLPVTATDVALAARTAQGGISHRDVTVEGVRYRVAVAALGNGRGAVVAGRSLAENDRLLEGLRNRLILAVVAVAAAAAMFAWLIARQITRRLTRLTATAEEVASTGRLDVPVPVGGADEAGRLGVAFNEMLGALARSKADQHRLVQDAGHELRTPLTSLRTNISVLRRFERLDGTQRQAILDDLEGETRELTDLVNELVELATDQRDDEPSAPVVLADLARRVSERSGRRTGREIVVTADGTSIVGRARAIERAMTNLVENAAKFDPDGKAPIELVCQGGRIEVRDRGPGIPPEDLPHIFDRFFRAMSSRSRPGSGLGLAIVQAVAEGHGGTVFAANRDGGGAVVGFTVTGRAG